LTQSHIVLRIAIHPIPGVTSLRPLMKAITPVDQTQVTSRRARCHMLQIHDMARRGTDKVAFLPIDRARTPLLATSIKGSIPPMPDILTRCPKTGRTIKTGLTTDMIEIDSLPRVPVPVWCPECDSTHFWTSLTAWIANQTGNQTAAE
jgi:hypothetical protein